jgi:tRNA pseudouridine38-40 synthase
MIGLLMLAVRTSTPPSLVPETFGPSRIHIPKAPALGLLLLEPQYEEYNKKVHESNKKLDLLDEAGKVTVEEMAEQRRDPVEIGNQKELVDAFKREEIYKRMWEVEAKDNTYVLYLFHPISLY